MRLDCMVIKPTLACTADCKTCANRQSLHKELIKQKALSVENWEQVISDAKELGLRYLVISGGEPTLYKNLIDLIRIGRKYECSVRLNTNGSLITEEYAKKLLEAGLDHVTVSLYGHIPQIHDKIKNKKGIWKLAVNAMRIFSDLKEEYPDFMLKTNTFISKDNYRYLPELIKLHSDLGSSEIYISYLEGDFERKYLLNEEEICEFKNEVIPKAIKLCEHSEQATLSLRNLYDEKIASISDFADGIYRPANGNYPCCSAHKYLALILANGDVHACQVVEYSHEPVVGNVLEQNLKDIWSGEKWNRFKIFHFLREEINYCSLCPIGFSDCLRI